MRERIYRAKSYVLFIRVKRRIKVPVGSLGKTDFAAGVYLYIGSAKRRMRLRLRRHFSRKKKLFWHVDYLLDSAYTGIDEVWASQKEAECSVASSFLTEEYGFIRGVGSSDCRCPSHLFYAGGRVNEAKKLLKKRGFYDAGEGPF